MVYMDLIQKLEKRFGFRELPETAQVQFNNARQTPDELLEDWADRVLSLATRPKGGSKYGLIIMLEPPHLINSLLYVFRPDIGGITPGFFVCCPLA
jgi:hypothetical protein